MALGTPTLEDTTRRRGTPLLTLFPRVPALWALGLAWGTLAWIMLLHGLGAFGLVGPDEPRYAGIAADMLRRHAFITPRLWGVPWFEKPVLYYWLGAWGDALRGIGAAGSRLPNAMLALLVSLALWWFLARVHSPRAGRLAGFLSLTSLFIFVFGRAATTDMPLAAPVTLGLIALYLWWDNRKRRWLAAAAVLLALGTLAKGPVAPLLAALTLAAIAASQRRFRECFRVLSPLGLGLYFLVAAPWYVAVQMRNPSFFRVFILQNNLERFATYRYEHPQPIWFFLPVLLLALFPWTGWLGLPLSAAWKRIRHRGWKSALDGRDAPLKFYLAGWILAPLVFFSLSHSKLPSYILPAVPGAVALVAVAAAEAWERMPRSTLAVSAALAGLIPAAIRLTPWLLAPRAGRPPLAAMLDPTVVALLAGTEVLMMLLALRRRTLAVLVATCVLLAGAVLALTLPPLATVADLAQSALPLARQLEAQCGSGLPGACGTVPLYTWHLNRRLQFGLQFELATALPGFTAGAPDNAIVLVDRANLGEFAATFESGWAMASLDRLQAPPASGIPAPWVAVRVRRHPVE